MMNKDARVCVFRGYNRGFQGDGQTGKGEEGERSGGRDWSRYVVYFQMLWRGFLSAGFSVGIDASSIFTMLGS